MILIYTENKHTDNIRPYEFTITVSKLKINLCHSEQMFYYIYTTESKDPVLHNPNKCSIRIITHKNLFVNSLSEKEKYVIMSIVSRNSVNSYFGVIQ